VSSPGSFHFSIHSASAIALLLAATPRQGSHSTKTTRYQENRCRFGRCVRLVHERVEVLFDRWVIAGRVVAARAISLHPEATAAATTTAAAATTTAAATPATPASTPTTPATTTHRHWLVDSLRYRTHRYRTHGECEFEKRRR
jgi:hypothetical protein